MDRITNQSRVCRNVFFLCLFCTLIFSSHVSSTKGFDDVIAGSEIGGSVIGSTPPSCNSRCENCTPCTPILVPKSPPAHPLTHSASDPHVDLDPEAAVWKCTCGGKLYDP
ncbi:hypothetical protein DEO72_LG3g2773 [Vigna unguiculata]|uniref:Epidermal patterning factor-like protein n=1 Tax=Vigna unguiculata TaxID=3917 RepID=A0A4D6LHW1_VIGUN|nr:hypothetical protein DEO72_LG3g2767 [Vigna unguiculata]QCD88229.1 hypothetical protein DEO72_LG3g2771 [Vigna unguiculata]QCD88231.1 hypothetical protein DEO72_LG3g2773 [Vigna unguiculata]